MKRALKIANSSTRLHLDRTVRKQFREVGEMVAQDCCWVFCDDLSYVNRLLVQTQRCELHTIREKRDWDQPSWLKRKAVAKLPLLPPSSVDLAPVIQHFRMEARKCAVQCVMDWAAWDGWMVTVHFDSFSMWGLMLHGISDGQYLANVSDQDVTGWNMTQLLTYSAMTWSHATQKPRLVKNLFEIIILVLYKQAKSLVYEYCKYASPFARRRAFEVSKPLWNPLRISIRHVVWTLQA